MYTLKESDVIFNETLMNVKTASYYGDIVASGKQGTTCMLLPDYFLYLIPFYDMQIIRKHVTEITTTKQIKSASLVRYKDKVRNWKATYN